MTLLMNRVLIIGILRSQGKQDSNRLGGRFNPQGGVPLRKSCHSGLDPTTVQDVFHGTNLSLSWALVGTLCRMGGGFSKLIF